MIFEMHFNIETVVDIRKILREAINNEWNNKQISILPII